MKATHFRPRAGLQCFEGSAIVAAPVSWRLRAPIFLLLRFVSMCLCGCAGYLTPVVFGQPVYDPAVTVTTVPGTPSVTGGVATDSGGNVYFAHDNAIFVRDKITGAISILAGEPEESGFMNGVGTGARFTEPQGLAFDCNGNLIVADTYNNAIRQVAPNGAVTTIANASGQFGASNGPAQLATFSRPYAVAVCCSNNMSIVYVADTGNNSIRKIQNGVVTTLAGGGVTGYASGYLDASGTSALFSGPAGLAMDCSSNILYVADTANNAIRQITADGRVTTLVGKGPSVAGDQDGSAAVATLTRPRGIVLDATHNVLYVFTGSSTIRSAEIMRDTSGHTSVIVGTVAGRPGRYGIDDGPGYAANFAFVYPASLALDTSGNLLAGDLHLRTVLRFALSPPQNQIVSIGYPLTLSVTTTGAFSGMSFTYQWTYNGFSIPGATGSVFTISSAVPANAGAYNVVVSQQGGSPLDSLRWLLPYREQDNVITAAYNWGDTAQPSCTFCAGPFNSPKDANKIPGDPYVADTGNNRIRSVVFDGTNWVATTLAGGGVSGSMPGYLDGPGGTALFYYPEGITVDSATNIYVADTMNHLIRRITWSGTNWQVTTIAGSYQTDTNGYPVGGFANGTGTNAMFNQPTRVTADSAGNLYVADFQNSVIRKLTATGPNWVVTTLAGQPGQFGYADGPGTNALFNLPNGLTVDGGGNLYVADLRNDLIRKVTADGTVSSIAGLAGHAGFADGPGSTARFASPSGITMDCAGRLFVADPTYSIIRMLTPGSNWIVTTIGGSPGHSGFANGVGSAASFWSPQGILADCNGNIYVADTVNGRLRVGNALSADPAITAQPQGQTLVAGTSGILSVTVTNPSPLTYQWLFNGTALSGQTNATLALGAVDRTNAGLYSVVVIGTNGGLVSSMAPVRVLVRPLLEPPQPLGTNGGFRLLSQDSDGGLPQDLSRVALQWRSTLPSATDTNWQSLSGALYLTNGFVGWGDTNATQATRFYRAIEY